MAVLLLILLPVLFLSCERVRGRVMLARYKRELLAKGVKLSPRDLVSPPTKDNGAPELFAAIARLKKGAVLPENYPPRMKVTPQGHAIVCFRESEWVEEEVTNDWEKLVADLDENEATLNTIRALLEKPVLNNNLDYSLGPKMDFLRLVPAKALTHWLGAGAQLALHNENNRDALNYLVAQTHVPRVLAEDRLVISELVRIAVGAIARTDTWEGLQANGWKDDDLARLQQAWEGLSFATNMSRSLEGELIFGIISYGLCRESNTEAVGLLYGLEEYLPDDDSERPFWQRTLLELPGCKAFVDFLKKQVYCRVWRFAWLDQDELQYLRYMESLLQLSHNATKTRSNADVAPRITRLGEPFTTKNFYDKLRFAVPEWRSALSRVVLKAMRAETERSLVLCAIALKRYSLRYGSSPPSLDALVPELLVSVPTDYMDGKPVKYHLGADHAFLLYSVGENGLDEGGDLTLLPDKSGLHDLWQRKDFVWPSPATADEVEAYRHGAEGY